MTSSKSVFQNGCHDDRQFGVPKDGLANPALQRRELKNCDVEMLAIII